MITDRSELQYPKEIVRAAMRAALQQYPDHDQVEQLKIAYVSLANFQQLTNEDKQALKAEFPESGAANFNEQVGRVSSAITCLQGVEARAHQERTDLVQDLKSMGLRAAPQLQGGSDHNALWKKVKDRWSNLTVHRVINVAFWIVVVPASFVGYRHDGEDGLLNAIAWVVGAWFAAQISYAIIKGFVLHAKD